MTKESKKFLKTLFAIIGIITAVSALVAGACILYKKYKDSLEKFSEESELEDEGYEDGSVEVNCDFDEEEEAPDQD